jgi:flavin reductase (DIM6/NTAB) family NADH-FMN oxidoreductase RutF
VASAFEELAGRLDYPMFVVTARAEDGERAGCLVGFSTQCGIDPVRYLVGMSERNHTCRVAHRSSRLAVHALGRSQRDLAVLFGTQTGDEVDKFARCAWHDGPDGVPVLSDAAAWFSGPVLDRFLLGDHIGFLIAPDAGECAVTGPMLTFADVKDLDPGHGA